ncbi:MAG: helix-turn-helix domain-containing protein [Christensenellaceae bacterium]|jgi:transcriptional regulator with XRE-family HTH domain|nr:helix-turn-helix domain-containing protein [Christensenellaceae bacterium]
MWQETGFCRFLKEKRRERTMTVREMAERSGLSSGYYSDLESGRRNPPEREILDKMLAVLNASDDDKKVFYDLAGKARSEAPPDLPEYINENEVVRVALRLAKDQGDTTRVWNRFIDFLEEEKGDGPDD